MDALLDASAIDRIRFVKMDCQGFECKTVDGMGALAEQIQVLKFENSLKFLRAQGCSDLVEIVKRHGFTVDNVRSNIGQPKRPFHFSSQKDKPGFLASLKL
ncbi:hypothetical protein ACHAWO_000531 [Cyclotella atomus]|uniref:Methyltransferase FkbM domain-containing protein n=1 Tax=Cyclotella atomus TaxID=382360 RepID=A0ABD3NJV3_9STRA